MNVKSNPCWHHQYQRRQCCVSRGVVRVPQESYAVIRKPWVSFPLLTSCLCLQEATSFPTSEGPTVQWQAHAEDGNKDFSSKLFWERAVTWKPREARVRIAAPRTVTLPGWIYNSHFNWCQEDTELPVSHFSTAMNRLEWTSGMYFVFHDITTTAKNLNPSRFTHREWLSPSFLGVFTCNSVFCRGKGKRCYLEEHWVWVFCLSTLSHPNST